MCNRPLVSDYLIAYIWHTASNAQKLLEYAQRREHLSITLLEK